MLTKCPSCWQIPLTALIYADRDKAMHSKPRTFLLLNLRYDTSSCCNQAFKTTSTPVRCPVSPTAASSLRTTLASISLSTRPKRSSQILLPTSQGEISPLALRHKGSSFSLSIQSTSTVSVNHFCRSSSVGVS